MASVSIAAGESLRGSTTSRARMKERSPAVRKVHFPATCTRLTPRGAYCSARSVSTAPMSLPCGSRPASSWAERGSRAANRMASAVRSASAWSGAAGKSTESLWATALIRLSISSSLGRRPGTAAHPKRREGLVLTQREPPLAHELQHRREGGGYDGRALLGRGDVAEEEAVEHSPVPGDADKPLQRLACLDERPYLALRHHHAGVHLLLPLPGIGREEIVKARLPGDLLANLERLRRAAGEDVAVELGALLHASRGLADRLEPAQAPREGSGKISRARLVALGGLRKQQARFQVGEPGRHDEVVGGELEAQLASFIDEDEVLLGQRQNRDAVEVDLLPARKLEEEIERAFEAVDIDMQGRLAGRALGKLQILE